MFPEYAKYCEAWGQNCTWKGDFRVISSVIFHTLIFSVVWTRYVNWKSNGKL